VTGALLVGAVVTGIVAISASSEADSKLAMFGARAQDIKSAQEQAGAMALVTDILGAAALVGAAATVVLFIVTNKSPPRTAPLGAPKEQPKPASLLPLIGPGGIGVAGRF
jgi:hypothetical protein